MREHVQDQEVATVTGRAPSATTTAAPVPNSASLATRSPILDVVGKGGGEPLAEPVRSSMEHAMGTSFSDVRVHADGNAARSAAAVQAAAYTSGHEIVFAPGQYAPHTTAGAMTLAHELTHVVQQRAGRVAGRPTGDGISMSEPHDAHEEAAEANAQRIVAGMHDGGS